MTAPVVADPVAAFDAAVGRWDAGDFREARELLLRLEQRDPEELATQAYLFRSDLREGAEELARDRLARLRESTTAPAGLHAQLAEWCWEMPSLAVAAEQAEFALGLGLPGAERARLYFLAGSARGRLGAWAVAVDHFGEAVRLAPDVEEYTAARLSALGANDIEVVPYSELQAAAERFPHSASVGLLLGLRHLAAENLDAARRVAARVKSAPNGAAGAALLLGRIALADLAFEDAVARFAAAARLAPAEWRAYAGLGLAYKKLGRGEEARFALVRALGGNPGHVESRLELARLLADLGEPDEALTHLTALLAVDRNHLQALYLGFLLHRKTGAADEAGRWLARYRALKAVKVP